jgi:hypothetical protein
MADLPENFLGMLDEAAAIVRSDYPNAQLLEATINLELAGSPWSFVFNDPNTTPNSTVFLKNFEGQFQTPPTHVDSPFGGDKVIALPIGLDLADAEALCQQQGCGGQISIITLRFPLAFGVTEPEYIFAMASEGRRCFVGVETRQVQCEPLTPPD